MLSQEGHFKDLGEEEIAGALDIEKKSSPDASGIFMKKAEDLRREKEERRRAIEEAEREEVALKAARVTDLREKISGKKQVEVTGDAAKKWQEYLETSDALRASQQGQTTYGGSVEAPMEATAQGSSAASFENVSPHEGSGERPAMFNLAELARQEEEAKRRSQDPPPNQRAA